MSTEGMEILRVVAKISLRLDERSSGPDLLIVHGMQTECLLGLTPARVRQARAIVTAAERKEINAVSMDFEAWRCQHDETLFCPDEGCSKRDGCARDRGWRPGQPSPHPPAPAEGGTDVAGLIEDLKTAFAALPYSRKLQARLQDIRNLGDALTAQAAALAAKEVERREQVSVREVRIAELEAVLIARKKEPSR